MRRQVDGVVLVLDEDARINNDEIGGKKGKGS